LYRTLGDHGFAVRDVDADGKVQKWSNRAETASFVVLEREDLDVTLVEAEGGDGDFVLQSGQVVHDGLDLRMVADGGGDEADLVRVGTDLARARDGSAREKPPREGLSATTRSQPRPPMVAPESVGRKSWSRWVGANLPCRKRPSTTRKCVAAIASS
jgi:hypothetical protein